MNFDELVVRRQTIRKFSNKPLEKEKIEAVIEAGRQAPFAGLVQLNVQEFRHFYVVHRDSAVAESIKNLCIDFRINEQAESIKNNWIEKYPAYAKMIEFTSKGSAEDIFMSEWLIIVAERTGMPKREETVMGYIMDHMWLKATELGLATRICSTISDIIKQDELRKLLGVPGENYSFDAMNIGYPHEEVIYRKEPRDLPLKSITYFEG